MQYIYGHSCWRQSQTNWRSVEMVVLNFTCQEKRKALEDHTCNQTIRTSIDKFYKQDKFVLHETPQLYPLHIWWNARNFHQKELGKSQFLGMGEITSVVKKKVKDITEEDAIADGFKEKTLMSEQGTFIGVPASYQLKCWLLEHNKNLTLESEIYIIKWRWIK